MARKPLLSGPVLNREDVQSRLAGDPDRTDLMSRVIENDAAKHGRAPSSPLPLPEAVTVGDASDTQENAQTNTQMSNAVSKGVSIDALTQLSKGVSAPTTAGVTEDAGREEDNTPRRSAARSLGKGDREPVIRLSIDVPEDLYHRIKRYVLERRVESTRALTLALYQDFLEEEGY